MRLPTITRINQLKRILTETDQYMPAELLARAMRVSKTTIYALVRKARERGIGIHSTKNGYILSEFALQTDDLNLIRIANGKITSAKLMVMSSMPHMQKRWKTTEEKKLIEKATYGMDASLDKLRISRNLINERLARLPA